MFIGHLATLWPIATEYRYCRWSVCLSVCVRVLEILVNCAKTAELIQISIWMLDRVDPRNPTLNGGSSSPWDDGCIFQHVITQCSQ